MAKEDYLEMNGNPREMWKAAVKRLKKKTDAGLNFNPEEEESFVRG